MPNQNQERGRVTFYIDNSYAFSGMRAAGWRFSWVRLMAWLTANVGPTNTIKFFASEHNPPKENQRNFYNMLKHNLGFELSLGETRSRTVYFDDDGGSRSRTIYLDKGLDVRLVTSLMSGILNDEYDTALLLSGDGDYVDAAKAIKAKGGRLELLGWKNSVARSLDELADVHPVLYLDDLRSDIERDEHHPL